MVAEEFAPSHSSHHPGLHDMLREAFDTAFLFTTKSVTDEHEAHQPNKTDKERLWPHQGPAWSTLFTLLRDAFGGTLKREQRTILH
jgi:hypothetical protein